MTSAAARVATAASDAEFMRRALALAERGWGQTAPNPMVGAVVVAAGNVIVGEGCHARYGEAHAEVNALAAAGDSARGATMYVSLEPCAHIGKTPPCIDAILAAGIARVVTAVHDPSVIAAGGAERLAAAGIAVEVGVQREAALELNAAFFNAHASNRPWVTLKLAVSADGKIADPRGVHRWISGPEARAYTHHLRANTDAIAVGVGTVLADNPSLTVRDAPAPRVAPKRVVFDSTLRTPLDSALVTTAGEIQTILIARDAWQPSAGASQARARSEQSLMAAGVDIVSAPSTTAALETLFGRGVRSLFVEGGAGLAGSLLSQSLVDRLIIFRSTLELGADALAAFGAAPAGFEASLAGLPIVDQRDVGRDLMTIYALRDVPCSPD